MKFGKLRIALLMLVVSLSCLPGISKTSSQATNSGGVPLPIFPLKMNYDYEQKYMMQWIAGCPQYSMISGIISKEDPSVVQIVLTETGTEKRTYYSNSDARIKSLAQVGLNAHLTKIDFKTGQDNEDRPVFAFGFADEKGVPVRWGFVANGPGSDKGAGPRIQAVSNGLLISYNEVGTVSGPTSVVQIGDKNYEVERWDEISKPPYFVGYRGTYSDGITMGILNKGTETWQVQSSPKDLSEGAKWILIDDRKIIRQLQITARHGDELIITEIVAKSPSAKSIQMVVETNAQGFALKSMTRRTGNDSMRITFAPELSFSSPSSAEHSFQIDQNDHQKVLVGTATLEGQGATMTLKLRPRGDASYQSSVPSGYVLTSTITTEENGYKIEVK